MCGLTSVGSSHPAGIKRVTPETMIVNPLGAKVLGIRTCSRRCWGCVACALLFWILAAAGVGGFTAMLTIAALDEGRAKSAIKADALRDEPSHRSSVMSLEGN